MAENLRHSLGVTLGIKFGMESGIVTVRQGSRIKDFLPLPVIQYIIEVYIGFEEKISRRWASSSLISSSTMIFRVPEFHFFFNVEAYLAATLFSTFSYHIIKLRQIFFLHSWHVPLLNLLFKND